MFIIKHKGSIQKLNEIQMWITILRHYNIDVANLHWFDSAHTLHLNETTSIKQIE